MWINNLKLMLRQFRSNKIFTLINILGLVIGMSSFLVLYQFVKFEKSYDDFHENNENIYRLRSDEYNSETLELRSLGCPSALAPAMKENFSEVESYARMLRGVRMVISNEKENKNYRTDDMYFADSSFLSMFSFPVEQGLEAIALEEPNTTVITKAFAEKTFGKNNPIGQNLRFHSKYFDFVCKVTSVLEDIPENSHMKFDALVSMSTYLKCRQVYGPLNNWSYSTVISYVTLNENTDLEDFKSKLAQFTDSRITYYDNSHTARIALERLNQIHLNNDNILLYDEPTTSKQSLSLLLLVAFVIIIIAWVNYINLSTAKAMDRAKEVGVRKVSGAFKRNLIGQFFMESVFLNLVSMILTLLCVVLLEPAIESLFGKPLEMNLFSELGNIVLLFLIFCFGVFFSGVYPAFVLSSFNPQTVLKGKLGGNSRGFNLRKGLVVFQFAASIFLIAGIFTVFKQVNYLQNKDLGMQTDQLLVVRAPVFNSDSLYTVNMNSLKREVLNYPEYKGITSSYSIPGIKIRFRASISKNLNSSDKKFFGNVGVDEDFIATYNFKLIYGRNFDDNKASDAQALILNETGVKALGFEDPEEALNKTIYLYDNSPRKIIGVIADYHQQSAKTAFEPVCLYYSKRVKNYCSVLIHSSDLSASVAQLRSLWETKFPNDPFDYFFLDEFFNRQYNTDIQFGKIFSFFTIIAIIISCLGLFGLSYHSTKLRTKEIGVRKSLGSSVKGITALLVKDTMFLVILSSLFALPTAIFFISKWLNNFAFKVELSWWFLILPVLSLALIAFGTVSYHVIKIASTNPVKALRYE